MKIDGNEISLFQKDALRNKNKIVKPQIKSREQSRSHKDDFSQFEITILTNIHK